MMPVFLSAPVHGQSGYFAVARRLAAVLVAMLLIAESAVAQLRI